MSGQASFRAGQNIPVAQWFFDPDDRYFLLPPGIRENSMDLFGLAAATVDPSAFLSMCGTLSTQQSANFISEGRGVRAI